MTISSAARNGRQTPTGRSALRSGVGKRCFLVRDTPQVKRGASGQKSAR
jgi:hypothetical protein